MSSEKRRVKLKTMVEMSIETTEGEATEIVKTTERTKETTEGNTIETDPETGTRGIRNENVEGEDSNNLRREGGREKRGRRTIT